MLRANPGILGADLRCRAGDALQELEDELQRQAVQAEPVVAAQAEGTAAAEL